MNIDLRTFTLILGLTHLIQVAVFYQQYRASRDYAGIGWWLLWSIAEVVGFSSILLRAVPAFQSAAIVVQNVSIFLGTVFIYIGILRFLNRKENPAILFSVSSLYGLAFIYLVYGQDDPGIRSILVNGALSGISFVTAYALLRYKLPSISFSARFNALVFLAHGLVFGYRTLVFLLDQPVEDFLQPTWFNVLPFLDALVVSLLWTFGLIIMVNQRLQAEIREAKDHFESIFTTSPDASLITRLTDGLIVNVNEGFTALTGFSREQTIGKSSLDIHIWRDLNDRQKVIRALEEKGFLQNMEAVFQRRDGSLATGILSARVITLQGHPHVISVTRDITDRKQAEEQIRLLNEELERLVLDRTAQLEASQKELEEFTYTVSHDLRSPLRAIDGYARLLLEDFGDCLDNEGRRFCTIIGERGRVMGKLIDDLLAFSRIGRTEMVFSRVEMNSLVHSVFLELTPPLGRERIDFRVDPLPSAMGDPLLLRKVWTNLIDNALKFCSNQEKAVIEVGCLSIEDLRLKMGDFFGSVPLPSPIENHKSETVYFIRDNGLGFDMAHASNLFRVFHSLHSPRDFQGMGAGLAITQRIIQRHGGRIWAEGKVGEGACFFFTLYDKMITAI